MKTCPPALAAHLAQDTTTVAILWKVKRVDGTLLGFSTHDEDLVFNDGADAVAYQAATGFTNTAAKNHSDLSVDNLEVTAFLTADVITEADVRAHLYDGATIAIYLVNWADLSMGAMILRSGNFGILKMVNGLYTAELMGLSNKLKTELGDLYGPVCRATFGSGLNGIDMSSHWKCLFDVTTVRHAGSVGAANDDARTVIPSAGLPGAAGDYNDGVITFTSGALNGQSFEIKTWDETIFELLLPMPSPPAAGDTFTAEQGCDHLFQGGCKKYNNTINFRGEPGMPGMDEVLGTPTS
jgi:uncharacterized phage protein (TIGR02218 family)